MLTTTNSTRTLAAAIGVAAALGVSATCTRHPEAWVPVETRQIAVPLVPGTNIVGIRDLEDEWVERIVVESDGATVTGGIPTQRMVLRDEAMPDADSTRFFREAVGGSVPPTGDTLARAYALCLWVAERTYGREIERVPEDDAESTGYGATDGRAALARIDAGGKISCVPLAEIYVDAARVHGLVARRVDLTVRHLSPYEAHAIAEVWSPEHGRWIAIDPTFSTYFTVDGVPAAALDLQDAVLDNDFASVRAIRDGKARGLDPSTYQINPVFYYRNLYYRVLSDPRVWLSAEDSRTPPAPIGERRILQTDAGAQLRAGPEIVRDLPTQVGRVDGRLAYQVLDGRLHVCLEAGLFEPGRFEVSVSSALEPRMQPDSPGYDPDETTIAAPGEYAANPYFSDADQDGVPDGWTVDEGSARFTRGATGELVVETDGARCVLSRREPNAEGLPLVASLLAQVEYGSVEFSIRQRRESDPLRLTPGPLGTFSPVLIQPKPERLRPRLVVEPRTRCRLVRLSLRRERRLDELVGPPAAPP